MCPFAFVTFDLVWVNIHAEMDSYTSWTLRIHIDWQLNEKKNSLHNYTYRNHVVFYSNILHEIVLGVYLLAKGDM